MTKTILFDLDGTLLDTERDFSRVLNNQLSRHKLPRVNPLHVRNTVSSGARALIKLGFKIDETSDKFDILLEELLDNYQDQIEQTECLLFPGIENLLRALEQNNATWGIVTNKPGRFTLPLVDKFSALEKSAVVICPDHLQNSKPDPEGILLACDKLNCEPANTIYVGDHLKDVQAADAAGAMSIAVRWGYIPEELPIESWQADLIINHPDEILDQVVQKQK